MDAPEPVARATKERRLREALAPWASLEPAEIAPLGAPGAALGYRTRAKLAVHRGAIGLYGPAHAVVDAPGCVVLEPAVARVVASLRALLSAPPPDARAALDALVAVDVRGTLPPAGAPAALVTLVLGADPSAPTAPALRAAAARLLPSLPAVASLSVAWRAPKSPRLLGGAPELVAGAAELPDRVGLAPVLAAPGAFVQASRGATEAIQRALLERSRALSTALGRRLSVLDLYGGAGTWSAPLAELADALVVDTVAAGGRREDAPTARQASAEEALAELSAAGRRFDLVIVNPPRRGLSPRVREAVAALRPLGLAYVSCEPVTLARDLADLARLGLGRATLRPFDMMPLTEEVETLAALEPAPPPPLPRRGLASLTLVDKPAHEPVDAAAARAGAGGRVRLPLARDESGWIAVGAGDARSTFVAVARGVVHARGRLAAGAIRYRRREVVGGHSVVEAQAPDASALRRALARIGHPVLGDARWGDPATNRHFEERHGLDRAALHRWRLEVGDASAEAPLAPDLTVLVSRLRGGANAW